MRTIRNFSTDGGRGNPNRKEIAKAKKPEFQKTFLFGTGLEFNRWIDYTNGSGRSNGYNSGDLIENPAYVVESILRDWVLSERSLRVDVRHGDNVCELDGSVNNRGVLAATDDYYNNAIWYNHTTGHKSYVTDFNGSNKYVYINDNDTSMAAGDWVTITNIQGDNLIDTASFDAIGNTTNGLRNGYKVARSINEKTSARDLLNSVCSDFLMFLTKSGRKYKLFTVEKKPTADGTFSNPLKVNGRAEISSWLSDISSYYSEYFFNHSYNFGKGDYQFKMTCNAKGSTSGLGSTYEALCKTASDKYRQGTRVYERDFQNIYSGMDLLPTTTTTMHNIAKKLINFYTKLRLFVDYYGDFKTHMTFEPGDQVKINYASAIPTGLNNSAFFIITNKQVETINGIPTVRFTLMQTDDL